MMKNIQYNLHAQSVALFMAIVNFNYVNNASSDSSNNGTEDKEGNGKLVGTVMRKSIPSKLDGQKICLPLQLSPKVKKHV